MELIKLPGLRHQVGGNLFKALGRRQVGTNAGEARTSLREFPQVFYDI